MKPGDLVRTTSIVAPDDPLGTNLSLHRVGVIVEFQKCFPVGKKDNIWVHVMIEGEVEQFPISRVHPLHESEEQLQWFGKS
jgi:hypothetical protein